MKDFKNDKDKQVVVLDDDSSYEKQWAEAIDQALADAALESFKDNVKDCMTTVLKQSDVSDRYLSWLQSQINKKIDILNKIIHLHKTEDIPHEKHGDDTRRETEEHN